MEVLGRLGRLVVILGLLSVLACQVEIADSKVVREPTSATIHEPTVIIDGHVHMLTLADAPSGFLRRWLGGLARILAPLGGWVQAGSQRHVQLERSAEECVCESDSRCTKDDSKRVCKAKLDQCESDCRVQRGLIRGGGVFKFVGAARSSRTNLARTYRAMYPEVDLGVVLAVDMDGWVQLTLPDRQDQSKALLEEITDDRPALPIGYQTQQERHAELREFLGEINDRFNPFLVGTVAFNPLHGVAYDCEKMKNPVLCRRRWQSLAYGKGVAPAKYVETLVTDAEAMGAVGLKLYPSLGYYPGHNCEIGLSQARGRLHQREYARVNTLEPADPDTWPEDVHDRRRLMKDIGRSLPWAPLQRPSSWRAMKTEGGCACADLEKEAWTSALDLVEEEKLDELCWRSPFRKNFMMTVNQRRACRYNEVAMQARLACAIDPVFDDLYDAAPGVYSGSGIAIVAHASTGGAELRRDYDKYGRAAVWREVLAHPGRVKNDSKHPLRVLLAHAGTLPRDRNTRAVSETLDYFSIVCDNTLEARVWLDFSNVAVPEKERHGLVDFLAPLFAAGCDVEERGSLGSAVLYGSDYWMNTLEERPPAFLDQHLAVFGRAPALAPYRNSYFSENSVELYGLDRKPILEAVCATLPAKGNAQRSWLDCMCAWKEEPRAAVEHCAEGPRFAAGPSKSASVEASHN